MPTQTKSCPFGPTLSGLAGTVGYTVFNPNGGTFAARTTAGISEPIAGSGVYVASVTVPSGSGVLLLWDTGGANPLYRVDESNPKYGGSPPATFVIAKAVAFGPLYSGLVGTLGLTVENGDGSPYAARTTSGIVELVAGSGIYAAAVTVPTASGVGLLWDTGGTSPTYARDQANPYYPLANTTPVIAPALALFSAAPVTVSAGATVGRVAAAPSAWSASPAQVSAGATPHAAPAAFAFAAVPVQVSTGTPANAHVYPAVAVYSAAPVQVSTGANLISRPAPSAWPASPVRVATGASTKSVPGPVGLSAAPVRLSAGSGRSALPAALAFAAPPVTVSTVAGVTVRLAPAVLVFAAAPVVVTVPLGDPAGVFTEPARGNVFR